MQFLPPQPFEGIMKVKLFLLIITLFMCTSVFAYDAINAAAQANMMNLSTLNAMNNMRSRSRDRLYCSYRTMFKYEYCCNGTCVQPTSLKAIDNISSCLKNGGGMPCLDRAYSY